ncbi:hypothetical protein HK101_000426 [Irineochytrium annulatum]|nr:hypothetical protein HK101_000426 [Irineochytrium annulatum]
MARQEPPSLLVDRPPNRNHERPLQPRVCCAVPRVPEPVAHHGGNAPGHPRWPQVVPLEKRDTAPSKSLVYRTSSMEFIGKPAKGAFVYDVELETFALSKVPPNDEPRQRLSRMISSELALYRLLWTYLIPPESLGVIADERGVVEGAHGPGARGKAGLPVVGVWNVTLMSADGKVTMDLFDLYGLARVFVSFKETATKAERRGHIRLVIDFLNSLCTPE